MVRENYRSKVVSILADLEEIKFINSREIIRLDINLIKDATSLIGYEHFAEGVFRRKHLLKHPEHGIKIFVYEVDLLNFLLDTVKKKLDK